MKNPVRFNSPNYSSQFFTFSLALLITLSLCMTGESNACALKAKKDTAALPEIEKSLMKEYKLAEETLFTKFTSMVNTPSVMKFINLEGEIVFEAKGTEIWEITDKVLEEYFYKSDFLMEVANEQYYLVK